eukprot:TRINITY_DN3109_c0_g1_i1.p1 TRINITY_DN3109_c0_g1~~TRINITY_DN3109_c0_g1_i1.p1  ORF type:complete len:240 (-),score=14.07 TRINITY_DN3109_c0_g1_i1:687-1406(-)
MIDPAFSFGIVTGGDRVERDANRSRLRNPDAFQQQSMFFPPRFPTSPIEIVKIPVKEKPPPKTMPILLPMDRESAAVKIQSFYRGFAVRRFCPLNKLKIIRRIESHLEDIQRRIADPRFVTLIRSNDKERLRLTEDLMSLLLKLDEIQGVKGYVRESRKSAIRDLVRLQETVDSIVAEKGFKAASSTGKENAEFEVNHSPDIGSKNCNEQESLHVSETRFAIGLKIWKGMQRKKKGIFT